jgi:hypothetical protein
LAVVKGQCDKVYEADDSVIIQVGVWVPSGIARSGPVGISQQHQVCKGDGEVAARATYVGPTPCEEEQVKSLSLALKDMMRKELLNAKENP